MKQAANMGGQVRSNQQQNGQIAKFLEYVFGDIKSDEIWTLLIQLCTKPDETGVNMTLALYELIVFVAPFYQAQLQEYGVDQLIPGLAVPSDITEHSYKAYIEAMQVTYPYIQHMPQTAVRSLSTYLLQYFGHPIAEQA
ncbi:MAG: hypothetical protein WCJ81_07045 [bacterium]